MFKDSKKCFCKYIGKKRTVRETWSPLLNEMGDLVTQDMEMQNAFFASVLTSKTGLR